MEEATTIAHIVKYADHRLDNVRSVMSKGSAVLLEVQTLGHRGLKYRHRLGRGTSGWMHLNAIPAQRLADTCGAGDWCTAGLIAKAAPGGKEGFRGAGARRVRAALRYGQALAAWNCGFEGARGGMYAVSQEEFKNQTSSLPERWPDPVANTPSKNTLTEAVTCPACPDYPAEPPTERQPRGEQSRRA